jgi:hypothetical protein
MVAHDLSEQLITPGRARDVYGYGTEEDAR